MQSYRLLFFLVACGLGCTSDPVLEGLSVPDGFTLEIVAQSPLVERPMIIDDDEQGRLYVAESSGSNDPVEQQLAERPHRILRLEDSDGDGVYDRRTVFADRMMLPEGVLWADGSLYVAAPPVIWKLTDTDDDGVADQREEWFDGVTLGHCANDLHGPYQGLDGWIYWTKGGFQEQRYQRPGKEDLVTKAAHVFRRRAEGGPIEVVLTGGMDNPVEVAFLPTGERMLTSTFLQHPELGRRDGIIHALYGGVYGKVHGVIDSHPQTGGLQSPLTHLGPAAAVGLAAYRSPAFGEEYGGNLFATLFNMHKVTRHVLTPSGATFQSEDSDFLVAESPDFHPTDVMEDADGSLLVVDTGAWFTLCCPTSQLAKPDVLGAIYRIRRTDAKTPDDPRGLELDWSGMSAKERADLLGDPRPAVRDRAIATLAAMGETALDPLNTTLLGGSVEARRNAVWALTRIDGATARGAVRQALQDADPGVRQAASHSAGLWRDAGAASTLAGSLFTGPPPVARAAAEALGRIGDPTTIPNIFDAAAQSASDPTLTHSLVFALIEIADPEATRRGLKNPSPAARRAALIALGEMEGRPIKPSTVIRLLSSADESLHETAEWVAARQPGWGGELAQYFTRNIDAGGERIEQLLVRFSADPAVQDLLAQTAGRPGRNARLLALRVMAKAPLSRPPSSWNTALEAALGGPDALVAQHAVRAIRAFPEEARAPLRGALLSFGANRDAGRPTRVAALAAAASQETALDAGSFGFLVAGLAAGEPAAVRAAAAAALSGFDLSGEQRLSLADALKGAGALELPRLLQAFESGGDAVLGERLISALSDARAPGGLRPGQLETVFAAFPESVRAKADALIASLDEDREEQLARLETLLASMEAGDARRGQLVFNSEKSACKSCHAIGYEGGKVGPDLTRIGQIRERRDLLEAILFPSASFVRSYEPLIVETEDDIHNGVQIEDTDEHLTLAVSAEEQIRIPKSEISEIRPGKVSVMPSGLEDELTREELTDLLAFLQAARRGG